MLSMTMAFAETEKATVENAASNDAVEVYDMSVNMRKLSVALGLKPLRRYIILSMPRCCLLLTTEPRKSAMLR